VVFVTGTAVLAVPKSDPSTAVAHDKIMGCYFGAWAFYRVGFGKFDIDDIDPNLCTHGFYGFADLNNQTWKVEVFDPWYDLAPEDCEPGYCNYDSYRRFIALKQKNPDFVPMISIGGWNAGSGKYSLMAADPIKRKTFVDSIVPFATEYGFEGVDLDWEYPGRREGTDPEHDKENFNLLVKEMKEVLSAAGLLFTGAFSPGKPTIDVAYDIPEIVKHFDFLNIMTYDYHGAWENFTGHNAPLFRRTEENYLEHPGYYFNVYDTIMYYIQLGAPKEKLVMGIPLYGRGFQLKYWEGIPHYEGLYCPAEDGIPKGPYTRQKGIWGYQEILQAQNNDTLINLPDGKPHDWKIVRDGCYKAPYMVNGPYWIGYDDQESIEFKAKFINFLKIRGAMVWSMDTDDFRGDYFDDNYHLIRTINRILTSGEIFDPNVDECESAPMCDIIEQPELSTIPPITTTQMQTTTTDGGLGGACSEHNEMLPYPGDCHRYFRCILQADGTFGTQIFNCGDWVFDPNTSACVDPNLPGNDLICNES